MFCESFGWKPVILVKRDSIKGFYVDLTGKFRIFMNLSGWEL